MLTRGCPGGVVPDIEGQSVRKDGFAFRNSPGEVILTVGADDATPCDPAGRIGYSYGGKQRSNITSQRSSVGLDGARGDRLRTSMESYSTAEMSVLSRQPAQQADRHRM